ncbi:hypothetical protein [Nonlabens sp.]|uniref:hypothetical protein n=1 Tax=Nonlabens sp. TaxID=1888209 RepID=UPI003F6950E5
MRKTNDEDIPKSLLATNNIIIITGCLVFVIGLIFFIKYLNKVDEKYANDQSKQSNETASTLARGTWFLEDDGNAGLVTTTNRVAIFYNSNDINEHNWYDYHITNKHVHANTDLSTGNFLYLVDEKEQDTLSYEILSDGRNGTLSLLHLDSGKMHIYNMK